MNLTELYAVAPAVADIQRVPSLRASPPMVLRCLLVSANARHVKIIEEAAESEGWQAAVHHLVDQALRDAVRTKYHLAFVDTQSASHGPLKLEYEQLAADLARNHVPLIVISGDVGDPLGEMRARQLGVWLYLPGFDGVTELDVVFREARAVHDKLTKQPEKRARRVDEGARAPVAKATG